MKLASRAEISVKMSVEGIGRAEAKRAGVRRRRVVSFILDCLRNIDRKWKVSFEKDDVLRF